MNSLFSLSKYEKLLLFLFVLTLPLINPWVRGDGVGYYAYARSLLIEHRLDFSKDWLQANDSFRMGRIEGGQVLPDQYTSTGHLNNHFSIGPAILWSPFLIIAHVGIKILDALGGHVPADGYSRQYILAMAFGTAVYGFLALWISFRLARKYVDERFVFAATIGVWFGSSLPVYMYFNPSWSHAQSAFVVAAFVYFWSCTRQDRTWRQWAILGALGGLMMDVYYVNATFLLLPLFDMLEGCIESLKTDATALRIRRLIFGAFIFATATAVVFLPTLITKKIIYGSYFDFGYTEHWSWTSPAFLKVLFSADHGLFSWTPLLVLSVLGLLVLPTQSRILGRLAIGAFLAYAYVIGCYQDWDGISSFGNRFFVCLTCIFVLGLASFFNHLMRVWHSQSALFLARSAIVFLIIWNLGMIYQWGIHLIPARGPVSWREVAYNQCCVVPIRVTGTAGSYFAHRSRLMQDVERQDVKQLKSRSNKAEE